LLKEGLSFVVRAAILDKLLEQERGIAPAKAMASAVDFSLI